MPSLNHPHNWWTTQRKTIMVCTEILMLGLYRAKRRVDQDQHRSVLRASDPSTARGSPKYRQPRSQRCLRRHRKGKSVQARERRKINCRKADSDLAAQLTLATKRIQMLKQHNQTLCRGMQDFLRELHDMMLPVTLGLGRLCRQV